MAWIKESILNADREQVIDLKSINMYATLLLLRLDIPGTFLDGLPCWEEWVCFPHPPIDIQGIIIYLVMVWAFVEEFEKSHMFYNLTVLENRIWDQVYPLFICSFGVLSYSEIEEDLKPMTCLNLYYWMKSPSC